MSDFPIDWVRERFPALSRTKNGEPVAFFDGPAGSQVPASVAEAVSRYLLHTNANHGGAFDTSADSDVVLDQAHRAVADFLGTSDPDTVCFGANMTTLVFALSRALGRTWSAGDEIVVTRLEHDANFTPWVVAAEEAGATVRYVEVDRTDCTLDLDSLDAGLSERTKLVAVGRTSNLVGTINPVAEIVRRAHAVGAEVFVDAVHHAPHALLDVTALDCDFLACSAYKFFGPHVGILYGKRNRLEELHPYKLRTSPETLPGRWMTGTQNHEGIAGTAAAIEYLAELGRHVAEQGATVTDRRDALRSAFEAIVVHERELARRLIAGLTTIPGVTVHGITDLERLSERVPTVGFTHATMSTSEIAARLGERGIFVWSGHSYALPLTEAVGLEPQGVVRVGLLHYNTAGEVDRLLDVLPQLLT